MQVVEPVFQVVFSVPKWNDNGYFLLGPTVRWRVLAPFRHIGILPLHPLHAHQRAELNQETPHCTHNTNAVRNMARYLTMLNDMLNSTNTFARKHRSLI